MTTTSPNNYLFLNRDGMWPHFHRIGLDADCDGNLRLTSVPRLSTSLPDAVRTAPVPDGPSGLAVDHGTLIFSQPASNALARVDGCDASQAPFPCVGAGMSGVPGVLAAPRGLLIPPHRRVLFVADSNHHRIQIFDLDTCQLLEIWGASSPKPSAQPGSFNSPWTMAADDDGNIYVVDFGNHRVQKFNLLGDVLPSFERNLAGFHDLRQPVDIAVATESGHVRVFIADGLSAKIHVFDAEGNPVVDSSGQPATIADPSLTAPMGLAVTRDALYVGDNAARRILRFQLGTKPSLIGEAIGYEGPVASLLLDHQQTLWVHPGASNAPVTLSAEGGYSTMGALWSSHPISVGRTVQWHRLLALLEPHDPNTHLDLFAYSSDKPTDAPTVDPKAVNSFSDERWNLFPSPGNLDLTDIYLRGAAKQYLWVGVLFTGDGTATPQLGQLRVEYDWPTYDAYLPAIYSQPGKCNDFLPRLLALFQSFYAGIEYEIGALPALFDPSAVRPAFLPWLAGCLGLDLQQVWSTAQQREILARIFEYYGKRGTSEGLREALQLFAGIDAYIDEPILQVSWWALPGNENACCQACAATSAENEDWTNEENSVLGWTTMLAPAQPQGAVVGTTADLDQSHLISADDFGSPLFSDVAYRFRVCIFRSQVSSPDALATVRSILDGEKPAHTTYELCVIEPDFRIGFQSSVGIDTIVSGPIRQLALSSDQTLGVNSALGGVPPNHVGESIRIGVSTRLA